MYSPQHKELFSLSHEGPTAGEARGDSMWSAYMKEAKEYDKLMTDAWKEDAKSFLVFAGLFSVTVAAFLIESYKKLSPDSGDQNTSYLRQISQQLAGFTNGTYVPPQPYHPPSPTTSIIWVNTMWLLSFVFSIMSALSATLTQQWARRYFQLPQIPGLPSEQARVRSVLFFGARKYGMANAAEMAPTLLHLSVILFFVGLVIFFFTVYKTIAIVLSIFVGLFGAAYLVLTILPCIDYHCPYRTPMSSVCWYLWHTFLTSLYLCLHWLLTQFHCCLVPYNLGEVSSRRQRILTRWLQIVEDSAEKHGWCLKNGFLNSIVKGALGMPVLVDLKAITWLFKLPGLAEKSKIQEFVAQIPGVTIVQLMSAPIESGKVVFREHLLALLRSCAPGTVGLDEDTRKRQLLVCLEAVHHIVKASNVLYGVSPSESVLSDVRANFANIGLMRILWVDRDPSIRLLSRSICALLARHLLRKYPLEESELAWLQDVMGKPSNTIFNELDNLSTVDSMNLDAYVYGVLSCQADDLSIEQATSFMETLTILMSAESEVVFPGVAIEGGISALVQRADEQDIRLREVIGKLRKIYETVFLGPR